MGGQDEKRKGERPLGKFFHLIFRCADVGGGWCGVVPLVLPCDWAELKALMGTYQRSVVTSGRRVRRPDTALST